MSELLQQIADLARGQQVAAGMAAAAVAGTVAFSLKEVPAKVWKGLQDLLSVTLVVEGRDELYRHLGVWFSRGQASRRSQRLMVQEEFDYAAGSWGWRITLGRGWHLLWVGGWPMFVNRSVNEGGELAQLLGQGANQRLWLVTPGRSQKTLRTVIAEAERVYNGDGLVRVHFWHAGHYMIADRRAPRALDTIFMPDAQKARLMADLEAFAGAREDYRRRGTPWRRGYLFEGAPGSIYLINLASVASDNDLIAAFNEVGWDGVVVIEDIDAAEISRDRDRVEAERQVALVAPGLAVQQKLTLSGLLNAIDGVAAREGRVLFATTNHPENLDPALLRAGRFDVREQIAPLDRANAWEMFRAFRPDSGWSEFEALVGGRLPIAAAELQNLFQAESAHGVRDSSAEVVRLDVRAEHG